MLSAFIQCTALHTIKSSAPLLPSPSPSSVLSRIFLNSFNTSLYEIKTHVIFYINLFLFFFSLRDNSVYLLFQIPRTVSYLLSHYLGYNIILLVWTVFAFLSKFYTCTNMCRCIETRDTGETTLMNPASSYYTQIYPSTKLYAINISSPVPTK